MDFTDRDLSRVALSAQLREWSELFRVAVAAPGHENDDLASSLWKRLEEGMPSLREAIVAYERTRGRSWAEIGELTGRETGEAEALWGGAGAPAQGDPSKIVAQLDEWYVRHAQVEELARVRDPFSRTLDAHTAEPPQCLVCGKYAGEAVPAWAGRPVPPGGHLIENELWRVGHGPTAFWPAGTLLIESRRHFLDYTEFTPEEAASIGPLIGRLIGPIKTATGVPRVHVWSCMEGTPHFHLWLVPRLETAHETGRGYLAAPGYCVEPEAEAVVARIRQALEGC
ncbi:HIT family protein [Streptosporangium roseum]|uniref:HIT family protein n=1 Tax=Streptosporangium roseum TaxID=2001 RepID=UPI003327D260